MKHLFEYNWQVRNEWFELLKEVSTEELNEPRIGGLKNISATLFHIIVVEYYWICGLSNQPFEELNFEDHPDLNSIIELTEKLYPTISDFILDWTDKMENQVYDADLGNGRKGSFTFGEVMRHVLIHEIHHIGQLSIWARELGLEPVSANFIHRGLMNTLSKE